MKYFLPLLLLFITACSSEPEFAEQFGYFKSKDKGRAFTFILPEKFTEDQIAKHAVKQRNTPGKQTVVFYYKSKDTAVDPTLIETSLYNVILKLSKSEL